MDSTIISKYFPNLNSTQLEQFVKLGEIYKHWNKKINVISRKDINELYIRHVLHSLSIAKFIQFKSNTKIVDIGTGGGFPGIPLAILYPDCEFLLVDSIGKKIKVVNEATISLGLKNVKGKHERIENIDFIPHFYVTRAVASLEKLTGWINGKISTQQFNQKKNGLIALKGGDLKSELSNFQNAEIVSIGNYFEEEFFAEKFIIHYAI